MRNFRALRYSISPALTDGGERGRSPLESGHPAAESALPAYDPQRT